MTTEQIDGRDQILFSRRARRLVGTALNTGVEPQVISMVVNSAANEARNRQRVLVTRDVLQTLLDAEFSNRMVYPLDSKSYSLRGFDFSRRRPERSETFSEEEAETYIAGCDYPESADDLLLALEIQRLCTTPSDIRTMRILDAMCGPGRLGRELLNLGAGNVVFHDGDERMIAHAGNQALAVIQPEQSIDTITSNVDNIPLPDAMFDLVVCHNSTHQLSSVRRLRSTIQEFLRLTAPGGRIVIADYQRSTKPEFLRSLEERLRNTRPEIVPLLIPTFMAAFSKGEFMNVLQLILGIRSWSVTDAESPILTPKMQERVAADPVKGHLMDYSPISLRAVVQK